MWTGTVTPSGRASTAATTTGDNESETTIGPKEGTKLVKRLNQLLEEWGTVFGIKDWKITLLIDLDGSSFADQPYDTAMTCQADWMYKRAVIDVNGPICIDTDDHTLKMYIVHELSHIMVNEMRERGLKHEERVVTDLTSAFLRLERHIKRKVTQDWVKRVTPPR